MPIALSEAAGATSFGALPRWHARMAVAAARVGNRWCAASAPSRRSAPRSPLGPSCLSPQRGVTHVRRHLAHVDPRSWRSTTRGVVRELHQVGRCDDTLDGTKSWLYLSSHDAQNRSNMTCPPPFRHASRQPTGRRYRQPPAWSLSSTGWLRRIHTLRPSAPPLGTRSVGDLPRLRPPALLRRRGANSLFDAWLEIGDGGHRQESLQAVCSSDISGAGCSVARTPRWRRPLAASRCVKACTA